MNGHLGPDNLKKWQKGELSAAERLALLEHVSQCDLCAQLLAESFPEEEFVSVPEGFSQRVQAATKKPYITVTPVSAAEKGLAKAKQAAAGPELPVAANQRAIARPRQKDPQQELRRYSLRVGIAACAAILFLVVGGFRFDFDSLENNQVKEMDFGRIQNVTEYMRSLTDGIFKWED